MFACELLIYCMSIILFLMSLLILQVKYGNTLRRFNAKVNENDQLDLDMAGLKAKVSSLFSFNPDADITLTYIDEDGDLVTLVDDDDLRDIMRQELKFLRIDVQLNNDKGANRFSARSSGTSTPLRSPQVQHPFPNMNHAAAEVLKSLPESLREGLLKLSVDGASKVASSSPVVAELVESLSKMGLSLLSPDSGSHSVGETSTKNKAAESSKAPSAAAVSNDNDAWPDFDCTRKHEVPKRNQEVPKRSQVDDGNATGGLEGTVTARCPFVDLNKLPADCDTFEPMCVKSAPAAVGDGNERKEKKQMNSDHKAKSVGCEASPSSSVPIKHDISGPSQTSDDPVNPFTECPFSGMPVVNPVLPAAYRPHHHPFKRNHAETMGGIFHRGIGCDGCGVLPITGPRFKSKVYATC